MRFLAVFLVFISWSASAQTYGQWTVGQGSDKDTFTAETANDSGQSFGKVCLASTQKCWWALVIDPSCDNEATYPAMANTDSGAYNLTLLCVKAGSSKLMAFTDFDTLDKISKGAGYVGFAVPMDGGAFRVFRFSLNGSTQAADRVSEVTIAAGKNSTRDLVL